MDGPGLSGHRHWYSRGRKGFKEGQVAYLCLLLSLLAVIAATLRAQTSRELFPNTKDLGHAVVEYEDDAIKVVAAYKYSQQNHDSRWLLIEIGVAAQDDMADREGRHHPCHARRLSNPRRVSADLCPGPRARTAGPAGIRGCSAYRSEGLELLSGPPSQALPVVRGDAPRRHRHRNVRRRFPPDGVG